MANTPYYTKAEIDARENSTVREIQQTVLSIGAGEGGKIYDTLAQAQAVEPKPANGTVFQVSKKVDTHNAGLYVFDSSYPDGVRFERRLEELVFGKNLFNKEDLTKGYIHYQTGELTVRANEDYVCNYIPVEPNTSYYLSGRNSGNGEVVFYDSEKNILPASDGSFSGSVNSRLEVSPVTAAFVRFIVIFNGVGTPETAQFEKGASETEYEPFTAAVKQTYSQEEVDAKINGSVKHFDKTVYFLGDSITADPAMYLDFLNENITFTTQYNLARSGAKFSHDVNTVYDITSTGGSISSENVIWNQVNKIIDRITNQSYLPPEIIFISAGTNDFNFSVGDPLTVYDGLDFTSLATNDSRLHSISGGIRYCVETILENWPDTQIVLITPIQKGIADNSKIFEIADVMIQCGGLGAMETVDQSRKSGIYGRYEIGVNHKYLYDGGHPNTEGGRKIAGFLTKALSNIIVE